jgi:uncharacterized protein (TIGR02246 family)
VVYNRAEVETGSRPAFTDPSALNKLSADWAAAFNAKDAAKIASRYADDAVVTPPNQPMVKGRANIEAHWKREIQQGATNLQLKPIESAISGSQAFEAGISTMTLRGGQRDLGKYAVVLKRVGNDWKIAYDVYNSDAPPAPKKIRRAKTPFPTSPFGSGWEGDFYKATKNSASLQAFWGYLPYSAERRGVKSEGESRVPPLLL